ncbi:MAG: hypothetical protein ACJASK_000451, partial [Ilumatobacter sp.]
HASFAHAHFSSAVSVIRGYCDFLFASAVSQSTVERFRTIWQS